MDWQPIETAPEGIPRIRGAATVTWMMLAWSDAEGNMEAGQGMRVNNRFYSVGVFHCGGLFDGKQYRFCEIEVTPIYWAPMIEPPIEDPRIGPSA